MRFLLLAASLYASVLAQSAPQLQNVPTDVQVGKTYSLSWTGGDNSPVSLTLMAGPANSLSQIQKLAGKNLNHLFGRISRQQIY
jgi:hypothetical protein